MWRVVAGHWQHMYGTYGFKREASWPFCRRSCCCWRRLPTSSSLRCKYPRHLPSTNCSIEELELLTWYPFAGLAPPPRGSGRRDIMRTVISFTLGRGSTPIAHDLAKNKDSSVESSVNCGHSISRNKEQDRRRVNLNSMNITFIIFYMCLVEMRRSSVSVIIVPLVCHTCCLAIF